MKKSFSGLVLNKEKVSDAQKVGHPLDTAPQERVRPALRDLEIDQIAPDQNQPRKSFDGIEELAQSIKEKGVLQPITVVRVGDKFRIRHGERRWRASQLAGCKTIPAIIMHPVEDADELQLIENMQREDLSPIEESLSIKRIITTKNLTQTEMAQHLGKTQPYISQSLAIASYVENNETENLLSIRTASGAKLSREHLVQIAAVKDNIERQALLREIVCGTLTVKQTREKKNAANRKLLVPNLKVLGRILKSTRKHLSFTGFEDLEVDNPTNRDLILKEINATRDHLIREVGKLDTLKGRLSGD